MTAPYAQCPHCRTIFGLEPGELEQAPERMRCGNCLRPFPVRDHLLDALPAAPAPPSQPVPSEAPPAAADAPVAAPAPVEAEELPPALAGDVAAPPVSWPRRAAAGLALVVLGALLAVQTALFHPAWTARLAPPVAPAVELLMPAREVLRVALGKSPEPYRDLGRITLESRDVHSLPGVPGGLLARGVLVSRSPLAQPFPVLELALFDVNGATLAARRFAPREYLGGPAPGPMMPGKPYRFALRLLAPRLDAVSYEFSFH